MSWWWPFSSRTFSPAPLRRPRYSLEQALLKALPGSTTKRCLESSSDWRQLPAMVSEAHRIPLSELLRRLGVIFKVRVSSEALPLSFDGASGINLHECRMQGAIPALKGRVVQALLCVDPQRASSLGSIMGAQELVVAPWSQIQRALHETENIIRAGGRALQRDTEDRNHMLAGKALSFVLSEARRHSALNLWIGREEVGYSYRFTTIHGASASGTIHAHIWPYLSAILSGPQGREHAVVRGSEQEGFLVDLDRSGDARAPKTEEKENAAAIVEGGVALPGSARSIVRAASDEQPRINGTPVALVVEDNKTFAAVVSRFLSRSGVQALTCGSVAAALQYLEGAPQLPALVISDIHMPGGDGIELLRQLRADSRWRRLPVLMLTSDTETEIELRALQTGADLVLPKSVDPRVLCAHAERLLQRGAHMRTGEAA